VAWKSAETQAELTAAAVGEFAPHGRSGTRVQAIAERAWVNKERLCKYFGYFGSREQLFAAALG
jgi:AcrR family transcriptional regulator